MLAKCYIEVLGLDKQSDSAQRLIKWKQPVEGQVGDRRRMAQLIVFRLMDSLGTLPAYVIMRLPPVRLWRRETSTFPSRLSTRCLTNLPRDA